VIVDDNICLTVKLALRIFRGCLYRFLDALSFCHPVALPWVKDLGKGSDLRSISGGFLTIHSRVQAEAARGHFSLKYHRGSFAQKRCFSMTDVEGLVVNEFGLS
jgi:hypothetical protein